MEPNKQEEQSDLNNSKSKYKNQARTHQQPTQDNKDNPGEEKEDQSSSSASKIFDGTRPKVRPQPKLTDPPLPTERSKFNANTQHKPAGKNTISLILNLEPPPFLFPSSALW